MSRDAQVSISSKSPGCLLLQKLTLILRSCGLQLWCLAFVTRFPLLMLDAITALQFCCQSAVLCDLWRRWSAAQIPGFSDSESEDEKISPRPIASPFPVNVQQLPFYGSLTIPIFLDPFLLDLVSNKRFLLTATQGTQRNG